MAEAIGRRSGQWWSGRGTTALIVDRHRLFADLMVPMLELAGIDSAATAVTPVEALAHVRRTAPDLVLLALSVPDGLSIALGSQLQERAPATTLVAIVDTFNQRQAETAVGAGFRGYLSKQVPLETFLEAVRASLSGAVVVRGTAAARRPLHADPSLLLASYLTPREREILAMLVRGLGAVTIARHLRISRNTVRTHIANVIRKLGVRSRLEAAAFAARNGLTGPEVSTMLTTGAGGA